MRKLVWIAVISFVVWGYFDRDQKRRVAAANEQSEQFRKSNAVDAGTAPIKVNRPIDPSPVVTREDQFRCDGRVYCSQMTSRAEAEFFLKNCPNTKMDGDNDGIPCENDNRF